jgi:Domain of unknown function (DUF5753)
VSTVQPGGGPTVRRMLLGAQLRVLPQWFRAHVDLESAATLIRTYQGQFVPGLLQTDQHRYVHTATDLH